VKKLKQSIFTADGDNSAKIARTIYLSKTTVYEVKKLEEFCGYVDKIVQTFKKTVGELSPTAKVRQPE
jgi:hypothetical protein